jgi:hypothetical protein
LLALKRLAELPEGLLDLPAEALHERLGGPTLIDLPGRRAPILFVSVLMHGNETTGWEAVRTLLRQYEPGGGARTLPRGLSLLIGNTAAAERGLRHLPEQPDFNRVWPGTDLPPTPEHELMRGVIDTLAGREIFASVDVHNNTGLNPHYACINVIENEALHLAAMFGRTVVYFTRPRGVASMALAALGPAVTLECGRPGQERGTAHVVEYLEACLNLSGYPEHPVAAQDIDLFHTVAVVRIPADQAFGFGELGAGLRLLDDLDHLNFRELPSGTAFGWSDPIGDLPLAVRNEVDQDVARRYFELRDGVLRTRCPVMPSMLTRDERVIRQDCLCYLMERYNQHLSDLSGPSDGA